MKQIKWSLLTTAALASLVFSVTIQQQDVAAAPKEDKFVINNHDHTNGIHSNEVDVSNGGSSHFNSNDNTNREGESPVERTNCNSHSIPANDGHSHC